MARVALVLPPANCEWDESTLPQRLAGLQCRFPGASVEILRAPADVQGFDHVAICRDNWAGPYPGNGDRLYQVSETGRVLPLDLPPIDARELPNIGTHAFSRLAPRGHGELDYACFHFFPYGYLYRLVGLGPVNEFGHRIVGDFRPLKNRPENEKLVVCFGGSAVWGTSVTFDQSFPARLEGLLNQGALAGRAGVRFHVLNFGIPGGVVLNSLQHFLLFAADLRPDIVIAHDGVNDIFYGCTSDPWLLGEHGIVYQQQMDYWAQALHDPQFDGTANLGGPVAAASGLAPARILQAYVRRKKEFMTVARAFGARFIWGQQAFAWSKPLSETERRRIKAKSGDPIGYLDEFTAIRRLFDLLRPHLAGFGADALIDFDALFSALGPDVTVMADMVHLEPNGEAEVARHYAACIENLLEV